MSAPEDDDLVRALKMRAAKKRRSAEAEHRDILRGALKAGRARRSLMDDLAENEHRLDA